MYTQGALTNQRRALVLAAGMCVATWTLHSGLGTDMLLSLRGKALQFNCLTEPTTVITCS